MCPTISHMYATNTYKGLHISLTIVFRIVSMHNPLVIAGYCGETIARFYILVISELVQVPPKKFSSGCSYIARSPYMTETNCGPYYFVHCGSSRCFTLLVAIHPTTTACMEALFDFGMNSRTFCPFALPSVSPCHWSSVVKSPIQVGTLT